jgi:polar amino acid transport system permease protein
MDVGDVTDNLPYLLAGVQLTIEVSVLAVVIAVTIGLLVALARLSPLRPLHWLGGLYVNFFRSTPLLIQLVWFFYALPILTGVSFDAFTTGVIGLGLYEAAFFAEVFRAGILAVPNGQREAALAQGMRPWPTMRRIVLPQALRKTIPPATSAFVTLFKDSSLTSILAVPELLYKSSSLVSVTLSPISILTAAALIYLVLTYPQTLVAQWLQRRELAAAG